LIPSSSSSSSCCCLETQQQSLKEQFQNVSIAIVPPPLPPKIALPETICKRTVIASVSQATMPVSIDTLKAYFRFCGDISLIKFESPYAIVCFSKDFEANTALLLDHGNVCGGPIEIFRYEDQSFKVPEIRRLLVEKMAKELVEFTEQNQEANKSENGKEIISQEQNNEADHESFLAASSPLENPSVFVTNISPKANSKLLEDFFSYCGTVTCIIIYAGEDRKDMNCAAVYFENKEAATTASLLGGAKICDQPIEVQPLTSELENRLGQQKEISSIKERSSKAFEGEKSKSSVIASMIAAGYDLGNSVVYKAKSYDRKHLHGAVSSTVSTISKKASQGKEVVLSGMKSIAKKF